MKFRKRNTLEEFNIIDIEENLELEKAENFLRFFII